MSGVTALIGVEGSAARADEAQWAVRRLLEQVAVERPLVFVIDDLQWAEAPFLDLIEYVADSISDGSVLLLCMARLELLDQRPNWGGGRLNATTIVGTPTPLHSDELIRQLLGGREVPDALRIRVASAAAGNPLFAEELLAYLQERGHVTLTRDETIVISRLDEVELPPTIRALLTARLDQLPDHERGILERGAVEGQVFHTGTIAALSGLSPPRMPHVDLERLVRKQVLKPEPPLRLGEDAYRFRHLLIRDATYDAIPKHQRAQWHHEFATWLETAVGDRLSGYEEILAYHYGAAYRYHIELGSAAAPLQEKAAKLLRRSAERALLSADLRMPCSCSGNSFISSVQDTPTASLPSRTEARPCLSWVDHQTPNTRPPSRAGSGGRIARASDLCGRCPRDDRDGLSQGQLFRSIVRGYRTCR